MIFEKTIALNDFITLQRGFDLPKDDRKKGNVPVVASTGVGGYHNEAKVEAPGVVIGRSGSIGGGQFITEDFWPLNTTLWVKDFKGHFPRYVYYLLKNIDFKRFNVGSGVPTLNRNHLSNILVSDIGINTEKKIAEMLGNLDDKIELNRQINQTLESMAQAIFKSWFVDFEPVRAKIAALKAGEDAEGVTRAAMRAISGKTDDELDKMEGEQAQNYAQLKSTAELFPSAMQDSELGEVPEGWNVKKITDFGSVVCGKTPPKRDHENYGGDILFVKIPDMHGNVFATNTTEYLSVIGENTQIKKQIPKGSVCVSCIATVGLVSIAAKACHTNQQINSIVPIEIMLTPYLYFSMLERNKLLRDLASGGSATLNLNTGNFAKIELFNPSSELLKEFYKKVNPIFEMLLSNDYQIQKLTQLRDTLLPKLLSGELSFDAIDITNKQGAQ